MVSDVRTELGQRVSGVRDDLGESLSTLNDRIGEVRVDVRKPFSIRRLQAWTLAVGSATALGAASMFVLQLYVVLR